MEDDKLIILHGKENRISEPPDVPAPDTQLLRLLNQMRIVEKLRDGVINAVGKVRDNGRCNVAK
jgi:hypothetical protein